MIQFRITVEPLRSSVHDKKIKEIDKFTEAAAFTINSWFHYRCLTDIQEKFKEYLMLVLNYNPGQNILEFYNILVQVRFFKSKKKLDI